MNRRVIAIVNRKGGTGKTTSCAYIAMCLLEKGLPVQGIDLDPDGTWYPWWETGVLPYPVKRIETTEELEKEVMTVNSYIVIDTPPNDPETLFDAAELADEVIVPLAPTAPDVNRLARTLSTVAKVERMRNKPLASVLLTQWRDGLIISREVETVLKQKEAPLLEAKIRDLTRYTGFVTPRYLVEYNAVLKELEII